MNKTKYTEFDLVNTKDMFHQAMAGGYAVPAYNFSNMEQLQGILIGCAESRSPVILQVSGSARKYISAALLPHLVRGGIDMVREMGSDIPIALHLDHGDTFDLAKACIDRSHAHGTGESLGDYGDVAEIVRPWADRVDEEVEEPGNGKTHTDVEDV